MKTGKLKNCQRITLSLPKILIAHLTQKIPKSKRSKFVAKCIEISLKREGTPDRNSGQEEFFGFLRRFRNENPVSKTKTIAEMIREDRLKLL